MMSSDAERIIRDNLARIRQRMEAAASRVGRDPAAVRLIGVTKYVDASVAEILARAGCVDLGESRPQDLWRKAEYLRFLDVRWHMIGHLQRNKAARTADVAEYIHSVDSERILIALNEAARNARQTRKVLLEVNISGDATKTGLPPGELHTLMGRAGEFPQLCICGLMAMSGLESDSETARHEFRETRALRDALQAAHPNVPLTELSMGMSEDFEIAIEEGSTMVRIGSALFEGVVK